MKVSDLIKPLVAIGCVIFLLCYLIEKPNTLEDYSSYISYAVSAVVVLFIVYERWLWRFIPWKRPPVLKKRYDGIIYYVENQEAKTKHIDVFIKQSLLTTMIRTRTDINESYSITASIEQEYGNHILNYIYVTNPDASVLKSNPIQHGACRMVLEKDTHLVEGKYWTTSQTIGDIHWQEHAE